MDTYKNFTRSLEAFFQQYLIKERGASQQTVRAYGEAFKAYLEYNKALDIKPQNITLRNFTRSHISSFLNWIEEEKKNSISSRNQRLSAMRSFACFLIMDDPLHICQWIEVRQIPAKRGATEIVKHLSVDGMAAILRQIDTSTPTGRRNLAMLSLLYNSGTRVQELIDLTPICIRFEKPYSVVVKGKGNKKRLVPLDEPIMELLKNYLDETGLCRPGKERHPLFFNAQGGQLSTPGVTYIIKKYADMARFDNPQLIPEKVSPHVFRHSRAMHLLQSGVQPIYIRDFLGHVSVQTTEIYARVSRKQKDEAIANAYRDVGINNPEPKLWEKDDELLDFLSNLCSKR